jgi:hypothetical protein
MTFNSTALATSGPDLVVSDPRGNLTTSKVYPSVDFWPLQRMAVDDSLFWKDLGFLVGDCSADHVNW